jgi:hypothetical protein
MAAKTKPNFAAMLGSQLRAAKTSLGAGGLDDLATPPAHRTGTHPQTEAWEYHETDGRGYRPADRPVTQPRQTDPTDESDTPTQQSESTDEPDRRTRQTVRRIRQSDPTDRQTDPAHQPDSRTRQTNPTDESNTQQSGHPLNKLEKNCVLRTRAQRAVYNYLAANGTHITSYAVMHTETGVAPGTLRDTLRKFESAGLIAKQKWVGDGGQQGLLITVKNIQQTNPTVEPNTPIRQLDPTVENALLDRKNKSISLSKEADDTGDSPLVHMTADDISFYWPHLAAVDFGPSQIRQIFDRLQKQGRTLDTALTDSVRQGLTHADAALELGDGTLTDNKGTPVADPRAYIFRALSRDAYYAAPRGYISPEARRLRDEAEQARQIAEARQRLAEQREQQLEAEKQAAFDGWRNALSEDELEKIKEQAPPHVRGIGFEKWLRLSYYPDSVSTQK